MMMMSNNLILFFNNFDFNKNKNLKIKLFILYCKKLFYVSNNYLKLIILINC